MLGHGVDAVCVATPDDRHFEAARAAWPVNGPRAGAPAVGGAVMNDVWQIHVYDQQKLVCVGEGAGPLELGPALPTDLVEISVVPDIADRAREPPVAVQQ